MSAFAGAHVVRGCAELEFVRQRGRTVLGRSRVEAPLAVVRPFPLPDGGLMLQVLSLGPGLCGGDVMTLDITAGPATRVIVTTTAATRVLTMDEDAWAEQRIRLRAAAGATIEYYPCVTIPYPGCALRQTIAAETEGSGRVGVLECWAMGRTARAEYLRFRSLRSRTTISADGAIVYADAIHLEPGATELSGAAVLDGRRYLASGCWTAAAAALGDAASTPPAADENPLATLDSSSAGVGWLRALAHDGPSLDELLRRSVDRVSRCWGLEPAVLDRFHN